MRDLKKELGSSDGIASEGCATTVIVSMRFFLIKLNVTRTLGLASIKRGCGTNGHSQLGILYKCKASCVPTVIVF